MRGNFYIEARGRRRYFATLEDACRVASEIFDRTGIIVAIIAAR